MLHVSRQLLAKNPVRFFLQRAAYNRRFRIHESQGPHSPIVQTLARDGICIVTNHYSQAAVKRIRDEVSDVMFKLREGETASVRSSCKPEYGSYRLDDVETASPSSTLSNNDELINSVANAYLGGSACSYNVSAELRSEAKKNEMVDDWHWDTWKHRFKAFLYLVDVEGENAPLRYLAGSHTGTHWRAKRFWLQYIQHAAGNKYIGNIQPYLTREISKQCHNRHFREIVCTCPAGTLILFDTRGIHRGSPLEKPYRLLLSNSFYAPEDLN